MKEGERVRERETEAGGRAERRRIRLRAPGSRLQAPGARRQAPGLGPGVYVSSRPAEAAGSALHVTCQGRASTAAPPSLVAR